MGHPLFVGEDFAGFGDVFFDGLDFVGPVSACFVGVGDAGGVLALGLGEMVEEDFEVLLGRGAGHMGILERKAASQQVRGAGKVPPCRQSAATRMGHPVKKA